MKTQLSLSTPILGILFSAFLLTHCTKKSDPDPDFMIGKNNFTLTVEGVQRKYLVHVPTGYTGNAKLPLVIFCHGTGQDGELMYNHSGWNEVADASNIICAYPSALSYCLIEDGVTQTTSKWNSYPGGFSFCPGQNLKSDVQFIREMITALKNKYAIDHKRNYMVGFSNGGQFTATCSIEISDIIAAAVSCGGGGAFPKDSIYHPVRKLPVMLMFGNKDGKLLKALGLTEGNSVPMGYGALYAKYPALYLIQPKPYITNFELDESSYTTSSDSSTIAVADYAGLSGNPNNIFKMVEVNGLEHEYPNGVNYPINGAIYHWNWFKQYTLPD